MSCFYVMTQLEELCLSQAASEQGWQCLLSLSLMFYSIIHLSQGEALNVSCFLRYKCHFVSTVVITEGFHDEISLPVRGELLCMYTYPLEGRSTPSFG